MKLLLGMSLVLAAMPDVALAQAQYRFTKIVDTGLGGFYCTGMNNAGTVIVAYVPTGSQTLQLWRGDGTSFGLVDKDITSLGCPSINDLGETAYLVSDSQTNRSLLVRNSNGALTTLARSDVAPFLDINSAYTPLSNSGNVAYVAREVPGSGAGFGIFVGPAGPWVYNGLTDPPLLFFGGPASMNDSNTAAFLASRPDVTFGSRVGIYRGSAVPLIEDGDVVSGGSIQIGAARPVINNSGTVAFTGLLDVPGAPGVFGVYTTTDGTSVQLVGSSPVDRISINDSGVVAYRKNTSGGSAAGEGLYVGQPGSIDQRFIGFGDPLDGSTFQGGFLWEEAINNRGQIAFYASLADGRWGVYRADPIDRTAPLVTAPAPITVNATEASGATGAASGVLAAFLGGGTATDTADPNPVRLTPQVSGADATNATLFPPGTTTVTFRFEDASGNIGTAASQVTVVPPPRRIAGSGYIFPETATYRATFSVDVTGPLSPVGSVQYSYTRTRLNLVSTSISTFTVTGNTAVIVGAGSVNGAAGYTFTATAADGSPDMFGIVIRRSNGTLLYSAPNAVLAGGVLTVTP